MLRFLDRGLMMLSWAAAALVVVLLFAGPSLVGAKKTNATGPYGTSSPPASSASSGTQATAGAQVFASAGCGNCHTLKAAGATGAIGPNLDQVRPSAATVTAIVRSGGGPMPSFAGKLTDAQIAAVASYVSSVAGR
jgi:mono/diheme cytochrome c family protein